MYNFMCILQRYQGWQIISNEDHLFTRYCVHFRIQEFVFTWDFRISSGDFLGHKVLATCLKRAVSSPLPQQSSWKGHKETRGHSLNTIHHQIDVCGSYTSCCVCIMTYRSVEHIQHLDGRVFAGRPRDVHSFDVGGVVEVDQFLGNLCFRDNRAGPLQQRWKSMQTSHI